MSEHQLPEPFADLGPHLIIAESALPVLQTELSVPEGKRLLIGSLNPKRRQDHD